MKKRRKRKLKKKPILILLLMIILFIFLCVRCSCNSSDALINSNQYNINDKNDEKKNDNRDSKKSFSLVMVGDVLIHEAIYKDALNSDGSYDFSNMFEYIGPLIKNYDLKYCNQESIIGGKNLGISGYPNFNSPDEIGDEIVELGFNMIGLANNHAYDKGEKAINYSVNFWKQYDNVITSGSYLSSEDRDNPKIYEKNGIKYAFLAYTTGVNGNKLSNDYLVNVYDKDKVKEDIEKVSSADLVIVAMHWGNEYTNEPTNSQREIASYLSSLGVELIIGTHPHVVQPITYIGDTLVIYSLGNFISNQLVIGINPAIGLLLGLDINLEDGKVKFNIKEKELIYSYSDNSKNFKVIPFSKMNNNILKNYEDVEKEYLDIVNKEL